jgi:hypothetical protein
MVSRGVYESMMDPELTQNRGARSESGVITYWGFYNPGNDENGSYLSEDYSFFRRVRLSGGSIAAYYGQGLSHSGMRTYYT